MIVVTGGAGFIGSAFVWKLNELGRRDILVVDNLGHAEKWKNLVNRRLADYLHKDTFMDLVLSHELPWDVEAVVHMGACSSTTETDAEYLMENNYRYTRMLCQWCLEHGVRFINASSAATYGDGSQGFDDACDIASLRPLNMYGYTKQLFDLWARDEGILDQIVCLKFFNVYGPNEYHKDDMRSVICKAYTQVLETGRIRLFKSDRPDYPHGGQQRDFVYIKDCVDVMHWLLDNPKINGIFNLGTGQARTWNDLANAVFAAMGREPNIEYIDMPEQLAGKYQYFTQAHMDRLRAAGYITPPTSLEFGTLDYIQNYLATADPYL